MALLFPFHFKMSSFGLTAMKVFLSAIALLFLPHSFCFAQVVCEQSAEHIVIKRNGKHVLTYNKTVAVPSGVAPKHGRSGFIHPISTPSGRTITDGYPMPHHTHQHGLFFAWRNASFEGESLNFWEHDETTVRHDKVLGIFNEKDSSGFQVRLIHVSGPKTILFENWTVEVHLATGFIDLISEQTCATSSALTLERFHYGGMTIRGSRQWFRDAHTSAGKGAKEDEFVELARIFTNEGLGRDEGNHSRPNWVCMSGPIDGEPVAISLLPHPGNFRHPQHVRLHPSMPYFCFIPTVEESFQITPDKPWVSRYRIVVQDGEPNPEDLNTIQKAFAKIPFSSPPQISDKR